LTMFKAQEIQARRAGLRRVPKIGQQRFADEDIYYFVIPDNIPLLPAWCLRENELIVALFPQTIKAYLSRGDDYQSLAEVPEVARLFENGKAPIKIYYQDTPALFEYLYPAVQIVSRMLAGELQRDKVDIHVGLLPTGSTIAKHLTPDVVSVVRTEAGIEITAYESIPGSSAIVAVVPLAVGWLTVASGGRGPVEFEQAIEEVGLLLNPDKALERQAKNNLKQIGLAMHNYHDTFRKFPAAAPVDEDGKPLLSWRVHILPYIEQANLHRQFHLDEPWDSEHNKKLIAQMPPTLAAPGADAGEGKTVYLTVRHEKAMFPGKMQTSFRDITDGSAFTIMTVEASNESAVVWTKPDDYDLDLKNPLRGLVQLRKGGFLVLMGDGSVHKVSEKIDPEMLNALFTRNGGEVVDLPRNRNRNFDDRLPGPARDLPRGEPFDPESADLPDGSRLPIEPPRRQPAPIPDEGAASGEAGQPKPRDPREAIALPKAPRIEFPKSEPFKTIEKKTIDKD
ncbi:MAG: DUF1559 domain-containing protein, partial [Planctomycetes bacterium]|nr:DUF1559 domain-containing protein [Planctomycetota bacterium]